MFQKWTAQQWLRSLLPKPLASSLLIQAPSQIHGPGRPFLQRLISLLRYKNPYYTSTENPVVDFRTKITAPTRWHPSLSAHCQELADSRVAESSQGFIIVA
jgi:hypothetical protein